jgi:hypothetical protein
MKERWDLAVIATNIYRNTNETKFSDIYCRCALNLNIVNVTKKLKDYKYTQICTSD